jgi:enoyl-CoA hydratase
MTEFELMAIDRPDKAIYRITFNRPEKLNAFSFKMYEEFVAALDEAEDDDDVKVIVVRGAGTSFGSGQDLSEVGFVYGFGENKGERRPSIRRRLAVDRRWAQHYARYFECSKITVAQVHGHCLGTHFELMTTSDFVIAADDANIGHPGLRLVGPGLEFNLATWMWAVGFRLGREMMFTGRTLTGVEAAEKGLINRSVPLERLEDEVMDLARELTLMPADGVVMGKEALRLVMDIMGVRTAYTFGAISHTLNTNARFEPDEFNFFRERREVGAKEAFHQRDARYAAEKAERDGGDGE